MIDEERVTVLTDGRKVVTTASRHEAPGTTALTPRITTAVYDGATCTEAADHPWYGGSWPPIGEWLDALHASAVASATPRDLAVGTLAVPGHAPAYVVTETLDGRVDVLTAPFPTAEAATACVAWIRGEYDRLDAEWRARGLSPIDVRWEFQRQQKGVGA